MYGTQYQGSEGNMDENTRREYQTLILASLLHDVGKLLHRADDKYQGEHSLASSKFIEKICKKFLNPALYDINLIRLIVQHHHSKKQVTLQDPYFNYKSKKEKDKIWRLLTIVMRADSYSCAERDYGQQKKKDVALRKAPLDSIFSNINLDIKSPESKNDCRYHLKPFEPLTTFPVSLPALDEDEIKGLIKEFEDNIPASSHFKSFDDVLNVWLNILEKYTWAVPSDTRYETSDVSLYDHLRSTSAIAACLYKHHINAIKESKRFKTTNEFILVGGDFSGIQDYIFDITNRGSGGASKRLRARSFFISLFSEVTIHKILHALDLPIVCNLFSSGGKFLLLAPNNEGIKDILRSVKTEIEKEIHETYFNQFSFLMSWKDILGFKSQFKVYCFFEIADEMFHRLETEKIKKSHNVLLDTKTGLWNTKAFKGTEMYEQYKDTADCKICGKGPGTHEDKEKDEIGESVKCCFICYRDKVLGQELPKCNYIVFGKGSVSHDEEDKGEKIVIFHQRNDGEDKKGDYYVELLKNYRDNKDYYLIYDIGKTEEQVELSHLVPIKKYYANYIPLDNNEVPTSKVLSFEEISRFSIWQKDEKRYGSDLLGVLKADVDNLGLIFSKGFENPKRAEKGLDNIDRKTVSRYLTMSRMLELFFSGWVREIMSEEYKELLINELTIIEGIDRGCLENYLKSDVINFENIYTVYSGGDDMALVGPWETMIIFTIFLNMQFRKYACNNKFITLSAGLTFVKPKYPIASAIKQAELLLEKSKEYGKDRITLFGTTVEWHKLPELINFFLFLNEKLIDENSKIKSAFLYRLLEYHRMALRYFEQNMIEGLKYLSILSYDIGRNIVEREKNGNIKKGHEEQQVLQALINEKPNRDSLMYNLKIPLFWALYRNRSVRNL